MPESNLHALFPELPLPPLPSPQTHTDTPTLWRKAKRKYPPLLHPPQPVDWLRAGQTHVLPGQEESATQTPLHSLRRGSDGLVAQSVSLLLLQTHTQTSSCHLIALIGRNDGLLVIIFIHTFIFFNGTFLFSEYPCIPMQSPQTGVREVEYAWLSMSV